MCAQKWPLHFLSATQRDVNWGRVAGHHESGMVTVVMLFIYFVYLCSTTVLCGVM